MVRPNSAGRLGNASRNDNSIWFVGADILYVYIVPSTVRCVEKYIKHDSHKTSFPNNIVCDDPSFLPLLRWYCILIVSTPLLLLLLLLLLLVLLLLLLLLLLLFLLLPLLVFVVVEDGIVVCIGMNRMSDVLQVSGLRRSRFQNAGLRVRNSLYK